MEGAAVRKAILLPAAPHQQLNVTCDCSKVTPGAQILPSVIGVYNNTPRSSPPRLSLHSFPSIQLPVCAADWFILICSAHILEFDTAKYPSPSPLLPLVMGLFLLF